MCMGVKELPELNEACRAREDEASCMKGYAFRTANLTGSCIWHHLTGSKIIDRQIVYLRRGRVALVGLNYKGSVCSNSVSAMLPKSASSTWGTSMRLISGPQKTSEWADDLFYEDAFVTSGCSAGQGATRMCNMSTTAPEGLALTPAFESNAIVMDFFTTDQTRIEQFDENERLNFRQLLRFNLNIEGTRCKNPEKYPTEGPAILDEVAFGPSDYMLDATPSRYFLRTFKAYKVSNVTGIDWSFNVTESMAESGLKTNMTAMLMRESDYINWKENECTTKCTPPVEFAYPKSVCTGTACTGKIRGLGAKAGMYRLLVSYPEIASVNWNSTYSNTGPVDILPELMKQMVTVEIQPQSWAFQEQIPPEPPVEPPVGPPIEAPVEAPVEGPVGAPVEAPEEAPVEEKENKIVEGEGALGGETTTSGPHTLGAATKPLPEPVIARETAPAPAEEFVQEEAADQSIAYFEEDYVTEARSSVVDFDEPMFKPVFDF